MSYFETARVGFRLTSAQWRPPQKGALGALLAHWTLAPEDPALVSLPTGTGKTGVALAAPFLTPTPPHRVLVLVPSTALREQTVRQFRSFKLLQDIGALPARRHPPPIRVDEVRGIGTDWRALEYADVVVAIPQSISPASQANVSVPPLDFFDLVIVDEAHHLPSTTWRAVLDYLQFSAGLLLTATPFRLDKKPVPGTRAYHYPLRRAIAEQFYKPIRPIVLPRPEPYDVHAKDEAILAEVMRIIATAEHQSSALLVRAHTVERAKGLAELYIAAGLDIEVLTSRSGDAEQADIIERLGDGALRAVAVVGMLSEGVDVPRLRVVAYHDKHKSMPATVQLIGRLARVDVGFPQESVLVTVDDADVYPELQDLVRDLYREDADWTTILPGIVDAEVAAEATSRAFVDSLEEREGEIDPIDLRPMPGPTVYEVHDRAWRPFATTHHLPAEMHVGATIGGARVLTALSAESGSLILLVTRRRGAPPWSADLTLEDIEYGLSLVSYRSAPRTDLPALLFVDACDERVQRELLIQLAVPEPREISPQRLDGYLQSLPRISVSSIGMRNILAGTRGTSYKTRAGSSTDADLLSTETTQTSLGHVMMQITTTSGSTTVGGAFEKGKIWQRRYKALDEYSAWINEAAELLWFPRAGSAARLLPQVSRGRNLVAWPDADPVAIESNPAVAIGGYQLFDGDDLIGSLEDFELFVGSDPTGSVVIPPHTANALPVVGVIHDREAGVSSVCWTGELRPDSRVVCHGTELTVKHGYTQTASLSEFVERYPPIIYFLNGQVVQGRELFDTRGGSTPQADLRSIVSYDWAGAGVDIRAETRATAVKRRRGISIHQGLESYLIAQPRQERYRWVLCNDGSGEIADYLVIEYTPTRTIRLSLWHAKAAGGDPGLRIDDFQVVVAQALRSRSRFNDPTLWDELRHRIMGRKRPAATLVDGSDSAARLLVLLGEQPPSGRRRRRSWNVTLPLVQGEIAVAQPGLSQRQLWAAPRASVGTSANSLWQLFGVFGDTISVTGGRGIILGSP